MFKGLKKVCSRFAEMFCGALKEPDDYVLLDSDTAKPFEYNFDLSGKLVCDVGRLCDELAFGSVKVKDFGVSSLRDLRDLLSEASLWGAQSYSTIQEDQSKRLLGFQKVGDQLDMIEKLDATGMTEDAIDFGSRRYALPDEVHSEVLLARYFRSRQRRGQDNKIIADLTGDVGIVAKAAAVAIALAMVAASAAGALVNDHEHHLEKEVAKLYLDPPPDVLPEPKWSALVKDTFQDDLSRSTGEQNIPTLNSMIVTADPHFSPTNKEYAADFYRMLENKNPSIILICGDNADCSNYLYIDNEIFTKENGQYFTKNKHIPMIPATGNHDNYGLSTITGTFLGKTYSFTVMNPFIDDDFETYRKQIGPTSQSGLDFEEIYKTPDGRSVKLMVINSGKDVFSGNFLPNSDGVSSSQISAIEKAANCDINILIMHHPIMDDQQVGTPIHNLDKLNQMSFLDTDANIITFFGHTHESGGITGYNVADDRHYGFFEVQDIKNSAAFVTYDMSNKDSRLDPVTSYLQDRIVVVGSSPCSFSVSTGAGRSYNTIEQNQDGTVTSTLHDADISICGNSLDNIVTTISFPKNENFKVKAKVFQDCSLELLVKSAGETEKTYFDVSSVSAMSGEIVSFEYGSDHPKMCFDFDGDGTDEYTQDVQTSGVITASYNPDINSARERSKAKPEQNGQGSHTYEDEDEADSGGGMDDDAIAACVCSSIAGVSVAAGIAVAVAHSRKKRKPTTPVLEQQPPSPEVEPLIPVFYSPIIDNRKQAPVFYTPGAIFPQPGGLAPKPMSSLRITGQDESQVPIFYNPDRSLEEKCK